MKRVNSDVYVWEEEMQEFVLSDHLKVFIEDEYETKEELINAMDDSLFEREPYTYDRLVKGDTIVIFANGLVCGNDEIKQRFKQHVKEGRVM